MAQTNKTKYAILGVLNEGPGSGYDIKKYCDNIAYFWNENYSHIYPVLRQMEQEGLVVKTTEQNEGRPARNVYSATDVGTEEFLRWLMLPVEPSILRSELLLKLFFSNNIPVENMIEKLENKISEQKRIRDYLENGSDDIRSQVMDSNKQKAWLSVANYGKAVTEAVIRWCEETIAALRDESEGW